MKKYLTLLLLFFSAIFISAAAFAQNDDELETLKMYYTEEDIAVVSATRFPKLKSQIAENIVVITSKEIEEMNAHTLGDVLYNVTGVQTEDNWGPGAGLFTYIQGSNFQHVLVLIDGVHINNEASNTNFGAIPVRNIERIEIIKGPASSAWGSSLGGVINVITKAGGIRKFSGTLSASQGEMNTGDFGAEASGRAENLTYYLYGGSLRSNGSNPGFRLYENNLYLKLGYDLNDKLSITFTGSHTRGHQGLGEFINYDEMDTQGFEYFFSTLSADYSINDSASLKVSVRTQRQNALWQFITLSTGEPFGNYKYNIRTDGGSAVFSQKYDSHTFVLGADFDNITSSSNAYTPEEIILKKYAFFVNDTILFGNLSITPGLRYDYTTLTGRFISPSLGITYRLSDRTLLRFDASRGFNSPGTDKYASTAYYIANPNLTFEKVWSLQAGIETTAVKYLWLKATVFHHSISDALTQSSYENGTFTSLNSGRQKREGIELEMKTLPVYDTSISAGVCYINARDRDTGQKLSSSSVDYTYDIGLHYNDRKSLDAVLRGRYTKCIQQSARRFYMGFECIKKDLFRRKEGC